MSLTKCQNNVYKFIIRFIKQKGYSPTLQEICEGVRYNSVATAHKHLKNLEKRGVITRKKNLSRSIELGKNVNIANTIDLPILGTVSRGCSIQAMEKKTFLSVPIDLLKNSDAFILQVKDDSFRDEAFLPCDFLIVERRINGEMGNYIFGFAARENTIARINIIQSIVVIGKYFRDAQDAASVRIESADPKRAPIVMNERELQIRGVIIGLIRKY